MDKPEKPESTETQKDERKENSSNPELMDFIVIDDSAKYEAAVKQETTEETSETKNGETRKADKEKPKPQEEPNRKEEKTEDTKSNKKKPKNKTDESDSTLIITADDVELENETIIETNQKSKKPTTTTTKQKTAKTPKQKPAAAAISTNRCVWACNVAKTSKASDLKQLFSKCGKVLVTKIVTDGKRCYGYVTFDRHEDAVRSLKVLKNAVFDGKVLSLALTRPSCEEEAKEEKERRYLKERIKRRVYEQVERQLEEKHRQRELERKLREQRRQLERDREMFERERKEMARLEEERRRIEDEKYRILREKKELEEQLRLMRKTQRIKETSKRYESSPTPPPPPRLAAKHNSKIRYCDYSSKRRESSSSSFIPKKATILPDKFDLRPKAHHRDYKMDYMESPRQLMAPSAPTTSFGSVVNYGQPQQVRYEQPMHQGGGGYGTASSTASTRCGDDYGYHHRSPHLPGEYGRCGQYQPTARKY